MLTILKIFYIKSGEDTNVATMQNTLACEYQEMSSFSPLIWWFSNTDADHFKLIEIDSFFVRRVIFLTEIILNLLPWKLVKQLEH